MKTLIKLDILNNIGLYNNYEHTIDFADIESQNNFWNSKVEQTFNNIKVNFVNENLIKIIGNYQSLKNASYARATLSVTINSETTIKNIYYFINNIRLLSTNEENIEQVIELSVEEDVMQSYMFEYNIQDSYIEREHQDRILSDKTRVFSLTPEQLNVSQENIFDGMGVCQRNDNFLKDIFYLTVQYVTNPDPSTTISASSLISSVIPFKEDNKNYKIQMRYAEDDLQTFTCYSYNEIIRYLLDDQNLYSVQIVSDIGLSQYWDGTYLRIPELNAQLLTLNVDGTDITCGAIFPRETLYSTLTYRTNSSSPKNIFSVDTLPQITDKPNIKYESKMFSSQFYTAQLSASLNTKTFDIRNLKNFNIIHDCSYNGNVIEFFNANSNSFDANSHNYSEALQIINQNEIPIETNEYKNYLLNNKSSMRASAVNSAIEVGKGLLYTLTPLFGPLLSAQTITNTYEKALTQQASLTDLARKPSQAINVGSAFVFNWERNFIRPTWYFYKCANYETIFNFLMRLGYSVNKFDIPNLKSRYYYNFIKMNANIIAKLNTNIMNKIKSIYNNGITIWHYRTEETFLFNDYSKENVEMNLLQEN